MLDAILSANIIGIDTEGTDPELMTLGMGYARGKAKLIGISVASEHGNLYLPIGHASGNLSVDEQQRAFATLQAAMNDESKTWLAHNAQYDMASLRSAGLQFAHRATIVDTEVLAKRASNRHFVGADRGYGLEAVARRAGYAGKSEDGMLAAWLRHPSAQKKDGTPRADAARRLKANMALLSADDVAEYARQDAQLLIDIYPHYQKQVSPEIIELDSWVTKALFAIHWRGIPVDEARLAAFAANMETVVAESTAQWAAACAALGLPALNPSSSREMQQFARIIAHRIGEEPKLTKSGACAVDTAWLSRLTTVGVPEAEILQSLKDAIKMLSTAQGLRRFVHRGRIHPSFRAFGAITGRMSCRAPNLQQQSSRKDVAAGWRAIFCAQPGHHFFSADYSAQEPRLLAAIAASAGDESLTRMYAEDVRLDLYIRLGEDTHLSRSANKGVLLAAAYGRGKASTARALGRAPIGWWGMFPRYVDMAEPLASREEVIELQAEYDVMRPDGWEGPMQWEIADDETLEVLKKFHSGNTAVKSATELAGAQWDENDRYVTTLFGSCLWVESRHKALNAKVQGSAGDQTKMALAQIHEERPDIPIYGVIHDEIIGGVASVRDALYIERAMVEQFNDVAPMVVDCQLGKTWEDCH